MASAPASTEAVKLVLGSSSPRRRDLLDAVGLRYEVIKPETLEVPKPGERPDAYVQRNACEKAEWVAAQVKSRPGATPTIVISADTIVVLEGAILEKPRDQVDAFDMLSQLSGNIHTVVSGVTLRGVHGRNDGRDVSFVATTEVRIKALSQREIAAYIRTGEPLDKAGGYAAQGIGSYMVEGLSGSYTNVVGLPVALLVARLEVDFGYELW